MFVPRILAVNGQNQNSDDDKITFKFMPVHDGILPDAEAEAPILWPPDVKSQLIGKDPDTGKD